MLCGILPERKRSCGNCAQDEKLRPESPGHIFTGRIRYDQIVLEMILNVAYSVYRLDSEHHSGLQNGIGVRGNKWLLVQAES